jgi:hypothetical protein
VKREVEKIVHAFNTKNSLRDDCYYEARFRGQYCYLDRADCGKLAPICRLTYTGAMDDWQFAIFKWSTETYDPNEWMFPGGELVDGTVEGAMRAGLEAYPV